MFLYLLPPMNRVLLLLPSTSVPPLPLFKLFLHSRHNAAGAGADNAVVYYNIMLPVILYLVPPMDRVLLLLRILFLSMTSLPLLTLSVPPFSLFELTLTLTEFVLLN